MSEPLEDEVNEELRRQQLKSIWDRFGVYIIGFAVLVILSVGGNEIMNHFDNKVSQRESIAFDNALNLIEKGNDSAGLDQLIKLTEGKTGYKGLAFFRLSSESLANGNYQEALDYNLNDYMYIYDHILLVILQVAIQIFYYMYCHVQFCTNNLFPSL